MASGFWFGKCLLCGGRCRDGARLCRSCVADLPRNACCCPRCALPLAVPAPACGACLRRPPAWDRAWVPYRYAWPLDRLETRYKFSADLAAGRALAELFWRCLPPWPQPAALLPVPLHRRRLRQRGYDQVLELARPSARRGGLALYAHALRRLRDTQPQSRLDGAARRRNVRRAFAVAGGIHLPPRVVVFDDVMTTGATLDACARALKRAGVRQVEVWAVARVPPPGSR